MMRLPLKETHLPTPFYLYDRDRIRTNIRFLNKTFAPCSAEIFFAVKANTSIAVLRIINQEGIGAEVVSPGEIYLALESGFNPSRILYNNIARKEDEVDYAIKKGVRFFNFEAIDQAQLLENRARTLRKKINLFIRINPALFSDTHPHLSTGSPSSKFGIEEEEIPDAIRIAKKLTWSKLVGIHCHIGSQILSPTPFVKAASYLIKKVREFRNAGFDIRYVNLGGGFGIPYHPEEKPLDFKPIVKAYKRLVEKGKIQLFLEPGRYVVGNSGYIIARVISIKKRGRTPIYIIDAGMTENPRPAIYGAYHHIRSLKRGRKVKVRVTGPLCENSDEFGVYRLPKLKVGNLLVIEDCGAYTRSMIANYNGRLIPPEYILRDSRLRLIRRGQRLDTLKL